MKCIEISIFLTDDLRLKSIAIDKNDTGLESDSKLLKKVCISILQSISLNKQDIEIQDILNNLNIKHHNLK